MFREKQLKFQKEVANFRETKAKNSFRSTKVLLAKSFLKNKNAYETIKELFEIKNLKILKKKYSVQKI